MTGYLLIDRDEETGGPCLHVRYEDMAAVTAGAREAGLAQLHDWPEEIYYWPPQSFLIIEVGNIYKGEEA